jgi:putative component of membrane protein insertase Oxa1/YidC/SpoIIIJ protein YidD
LIGAAVRVSAVVRPARFAIRLIDAYQANDRREVGRCVFTPTCSDYARIVLVRHGLFKGGLMTLRRLLRCHGGNAGVGDNPT